MVGVLAFLVLAPSVVAAAPAVEARAAFDALQAQRCAEAAERFEAILKVSSDNVAAQYGRGLASKCLGEFDAAARDLLVVAKKWPERLDVAFELGAALTSAGAYQDAKPWLLQAQAVPHLEGPAALLLGLGELRLGNLEAAKLRFTQARLRSPQLAGQANYYSGVAELRLGNLDAAKVLFEAVLADTSDSGLRREAMAFVSTLSAPRPRPWRLFGSAGMEYDSNIILAPLDQKLSGVSGAQQDDGRATVRAGANYTLLNTGRASLSAGYSFFQSLHFTLHDFNLQSHQASGELSSDIGWARFNVSADYQFYLRTADLRGFLHQWSVRPAFRKDLGSWGISEVSFRYRGRHFIEDGFSDLDGTGLAPGARHTFWLGSHDRSLSLGYQFEEEDVNSQNDPLPFSNEAHTGLVEFSWALPAQIQAGALYSYTYRDYPRTDRPHRRDSANSISVVLQRPMLEHVDLVLGYLGVFNESNEAVFQYERHVAAVAISVWY